MDIALWLFDLDGVLTNSAIAHASAWKSMFDEYLAGLTPPQPPFDADQDYLRYVDGRRREDGIRTFLASRSLVASDETVRTMGDRKTILFQAAVADGRVTVYPDALQLLTALHARPGVTMAVVSSSANAELVLRHAQLRDFFAFVMDGVVAEQQSLPGKPSPATFLAATTHLHGDIARAAVLDDASVGVRAGRAGDFALVVGVDRTDSRDELLAAGADRVVEDLTELLDVTTGEPS